jgi:hypothetical protein
MAKLDVNPLLPGATPAQIRATLGAMRSVAETGSAASLDDKHAIESAARYIFGQDTRFDAIAAVAPDEFAQSLRGSSLGNEAIKFLAVMALVDGSIDKAKVETVLRYATALGLRAGYLDEITEAAHGKLRDAMAHMTRDNMESITEKPWSGDVVKWMLPYRDAPDPELVARFENLGALPEETFGHTYWVHFKENNYTFPGDPTALNAGFCVPHDSAHVLSGYNTTARGELLVSTFTASMHRINPMSGHVLPVIFTWHLNVEINPVAKHYGGALDPDEFWHAWAGGATTTIDTFAPGWDFWSYVGTPLIALRERWSIPPHGLDHTAVAKV